MEIALVEVSSRVRAYLLSNPALGLAGIALFVLIIYATSLDNPFQYDDAHSIVDNPHIRSLANIPSFFTDPTMFSEDAASSMYRPLVLVSYGLNHALGGYEPAGYHLVNLLVHVVNLLLVYVLVRLLGRSSIQALVAAAIFGVHPINSEAVNYVSSRSESISALFFLGALVAYIHGSRRETTSGGWQVLSLLAYTGALLSKSVAITLPVILGCYELAFRRQQTTGDSAMSRISRLHWPFWAVSVVYLGMSSGAVTKAVFAVLRFSRKWKFVPRELMTQGAEIEAFGRVAPVASDDGVPWPVAACGHARAVFPEPDPRACPSG